MQSRNVFERRARSFAASLAIVALTAGARADDKAVCGASYDAAQTLRRAGKLQDARAAAVACARDACAEFVRVDCAKWLGEIDASQPTVVFEVRDGAGRESASVVVSLDGAPWLAALDGAAKPVDPGRHVLRFAIAGEAPFELDVQIREGEKNRKIAASAPRGAQHAKPEAPRSEGARKAGPWPWVLGGVGVAGLAAFGVFGGLTLAQKATTDAHCDDALRTCDAEGRSAASAGRAYGVLSTVGLAAGVAALGASVVLFATSPRAPSASARVEARPGGGAVRLDASF